MLTHQAPDVHYGSSEHSRAFSETPGSSTNTGPRALPGTKFSYMKFRRRSTRVRSMLDRICRIACFALAIW